MTHVRQVTDTIHKPDGSPWPEFAIGFDVPKTAATTHATLPGTSVGASTTAHTIITQTNASGEFAVDLEVDVTIRVTMLGALVTAGTSTRYPGESQFLIVVPDGDTPITLHDIIAANNTPVTPTLLGRVLPEGGTTGQALVKASGYDYDAEWSDVAAGSDAKWGGIEGTLADQTDLAIALAGKADTDSLGTAAYTDATAYATAAQGGKADTAVQPEALADVATSGAYGDLTGTPAIPTLPATIVESITAGTNVTVDASDPAHPVVSSAGGGVALAGDGTAETAARSDHQHAGSLADSTAIGSEASVTGAESAAIGVGASAGFGGAAIGKGAQATGASALAIGRNSTASGTGATAIGSTTTAAANYGTAISTGASAGTNAIGIGRNASASGTSSLALGVSSVASASRSQSFGYNATSNTADTAVIKANDLDVQRSNGTGETRLALYSPNGTKYWLTVDDTGTIAATPA